MSQQSRAYPHRCTATRTDPDTGERRSEILWARIDDGAISFDRPLTAKPGEEWAIEFPPTMQADIGYGGTATFVGGRVIYVSTIGGSAHA